MVYIEINIVAYLYVHIMKLFTNIVIICKSAYSLKVNYMFANYIL